MNNQSIHIIIQARSGSTRLPNKMLMPFYNELTILEIIISNLLNYFDAEQIIVATTTNPKDDVIEQLGKKLNVNTFRGSEKDVLDRFIKAAEYFDATNIIRVCGDNPLLQANYVRVLADEYLNNQNQLDYLSFAFPDNTPVIKSHLGLFTEATNLQALKKIVNATSDEFYHEHVTNYMYANTNEFNVNFLQLPEELKHRKDLRMTVDTLEDFKIMKQLFAANISGNNYHISISNIISYIYNNKTILSIMANEIERNSK